MELFENKKKIDRRNFLKGMAIAGTAGAVSGAGLLGCTDSAVQSNQPGGGQATFPWTNSRYPWAIDANDFDDSEAVLNPITEFSAEETYDIVV
ncbi:MAG: twin-arginine translocation signal domain-containing protein, partial [Coriobacteriia bacterium]|nr:twin-arginine translocation signal domain-containing protein [Coriobacteriia bacterium]